MVMYEKKELIGVGNSIAIIIPAWIARQMELKVGQSVHLEPDLQQKSITLNFNEKEGE